MPRFDYRCPDCQTVVEFQVPHAEDAVACSRCGSVCEKLPAAPAFKVTGFNAKNSYGVANG